MNQLKRSFTRSPTWLIALSGLTLGLLLGAVGMCSVYAQQSGIQRVILQRVDAPVSASDGTPMELILGTAEISAGGSAGRHRHAGLELGYVLSGTASMEIEGEAPRTIKAGDSFSIPLAKIHDVKVTGDSPAKVLAVYLVSKGQPLATPAP